MGTHAKPVQPEVFGENLANLVGIARIWERRGQYFFQFNFQLVEPGPDVR